MADFKKLLSEVTDLVSFEKAEIVSGIVNGTYFLIVQGHVPDANTRVKLVPVTYVDKPEYWEIMVVGIRLPIGLPSVRAYCKLIEITEVKGTKGIVVLGAGGQSQQIDIP